jgi:hypothetical protein
VTNYFNAKLIEMAEMDETKDKRVSSKTVGKILRDGLGFREGRLEHGGYNTIMITKERIEQLKGLYGHEEPAKKTLSSWLWKFLQLEPFPARCGLVFAPDAWHIFRSYANHVYVFV